MTDPCPLHHRPTCHECAVRGDAPDGQDHAYESAVLDQLAAVQRERDALARRLDDVTQERDHHRQRRVEWTQRAQELSAEVTRLQTALREIDAAQSWHDVIRVCSAALGDEREGG